MLKRQRRFYLLKAQTGQCSGLRQPFGCLHTHSSLRPLHKPASGHANVGQRKQRDGLCGVLGTPPVAHFDATARALDNPKRMPHLGPHAGVELLGLFVQRSPVRVLLRAVPSSSHGYIPIAAIGVRSFTGALVARVRKDNLFFTVQQRMALPGIVDVGLRAADRMHQARLRVHPNMGFHAEVRLIALLDLVPLGATLTGLVFGRAGRRNQRGVYHGARLGHRCVRRYERQQIAPGHDVVHFFEQDLLTRATGAGVCLFPAVTTRNFRVPIEVIGVGF